IVVLRVPAAVLISSLCDDPPPTQLYTLSLHDALPICPCPAPLRGPLRPRHSAPRCWSGTRYRRSRRQSPPCDGSCPRSHPWYPRSEEHTSELQSRENLVCRLLLEKKKKSHTR